MATNCLPTTYSCEYIADSLTHSVILKLQQQTLPWAQATWLLSSLATPPPQFVMGEKVSVMVAILSTKYTWALGVPGIHRQSGEKILTTTDGCHMTGATVVRHYKTSRRTGCGLTPACTMRHSLVMLALFPGVLIVYRRTMQHLYDLRTLCKRGSSLTSFLSNL